MTSVSQVFVEIAFFAPEDAAAGGDAYGSGGLPQLDISTWPGQIFWLLVTFGLLFFILSNSVLPKIAATIEDRRDRIADDWDAAEQNKRQAEQAAADYEKNLADARAKAHNIVATTRKEVEAEIAEGNREVEKQINSELDAAEERISAMRKDALSHLDDISSELADELVSKLISEPNAGSA
ncbi:F0F1 ATP synthase subunit B' [Hyphobacterium sp.]|uniref:F0F1 ATP synthase subunit B family protein n=1 Tax=Hyphobacterium sp. TaxID=2004662 RepID=UPI003BAA3201